MQRWSLAAVKVGWSSAPKLSNTLLYVKVASLLLSSRIAAVKCLAAVHSGQSIQPSWLAHSLPVVSVKLKYEQAGMPVSLANNGPGAVRAPAYY